MDRLRKAILALLEEDYDVIGEPTDATINVVEAWNDLPDVEPFDLDEWRDA